MSTEIIIAQGISETTITSNSFTTTIAASSIGVTLIETTGQGPQGSSGTTIQSINFSYGDATPKSILTVASGKRIAKVQLEISTAFNGSGAALSLGFVNEAEALFPSALLDPTLLYIFEENPSMLLASQKEILLFITPGTGTSQGSGTIFLSII